MPISNAFKFANNILTNGGYDAADLVGAAGGGASAFRNIVINGDMRIAQRATSKANVGFEYATLDRWQTVNGSLGTWTQSQSTDVPSGYGFPYSLKMDCTTADASPASGDEIYIRQLFEGQNLQYLKKGTASAVSLTASFWVKSTKTGTFIVELVDDDNSRSISKSYTVNTTNTWEFKTVTFAGDTTGAFANDNGQSLNLNFWIATGSGQSSGTLQTSWGTTTTANRAVGQVNCADSTSNDWLITGVQLEAGTSATDFEFLPIDVSLGRCERYCLTVAKGTVAGNKIAFGTAYTTTDWYGIYTLRTVMRTTPTLTQTTGTNFYSIFGNNSSAQFNSLSNIQTHNEYNVTFNQDGRSITQGYSYWVETSNSSALVLLTAEL